MIDPAAISSQIQQMIENTKALDQKSAEKAFSDQLAQIIAQALLSAEVNTVVTTTGTATTQSGTGIGKLS